VTRAVSPRPLTTEAWVRSQISPSGICGGQIGTRAGFPPRAPVFLSLYHSTSAPDSFSSTYAHRSRSRKTSVRSLVTSKKKNKNNAVSEICQHWIEKYFHIILEGLSIFSNVGGPLSYRMTPQTHLSVPLKISE
jgi:hypothetical protein